MIRMNAQAELQGMDFARIAQRFLQPDAKADAIAPSSNKTAQHPVLAPCSGNGWWPMIWGAWSGSICCWCCYRWALRR